MIHTDTGSRIEGERMEFQTRKFTPLPPKFDETIVPNLKIHPFKLGIFGSSSIQAALNAGDRAYFDDSKLAVGDEVRGETLSCFTVGKPCTAPQVNSATGSHKATFCQSRTRGHARIEIGTRQMLAIARQKPSSAGLAEPTQSSLVSKIGDWYEVERAISAFEEGLPALLAGGAAQSEKIQELYDGVLQLAGPERKPYVELRLSAIVANATQQADDV
jgi:hypothetical protein